MAKTPSYSEIHREHSTWLNTLNFYHDEIKYYQTKLAEVAAKHQYDQVHKKILDYKNSFFDILKDLDELRYKIYKHEHELENLEELSQRTKGIRINEAHDQQRNDIAEFEERYKVLKNDFNELLKQEEIE